MAGMYEPQRLAINLLKRALKIAENNSHLFFLINQLLTQSIASPILLHYDRSEILKTELLLHESCRH
jgi:hypothetical protein